MIRGLDITSHVGVGINNKLDRERALTLDGRQMETDSPLWADRSTHRGLYGCFSLDPDGKLNSVPCARKFSIPQICEYIGMNFLYAAPAPKYYHEDEAWTYDLGRPQSIGSVLFIAGEDTGREEVTVTLRQA